MKKFLHRIYLGTPYRSFSGNLTKNHSYGNSSISFSLYENSSESCTGDSSESSFSDIHLLLGFLHEFFFCENPFKSFLAGIITGGAFAILLEVSPWNCLRSSFPGILSDVFSLVFLYEFLRCDFS